MFERLNDITNEIDNIDVLNMLKNEISKKGANVKDVIEKFISDYEDASEKETIALVNLGTSRTIYDHSRLIAKMNPCSKPQNYSDSTITARSNWNVIYEIAFGSTDLEIKSESTTHTKEKQRIFKEAA